jgi:hypothetical protein
MKMDERRLETDAIKLVNDATPIGHVWIRSEPGDGELAWGYVVANTNGLAGDPYATWLFSEDERGACHCYEGRYFQERTEAIRDFAWRIAGSAGRAQR